MESSRAEEACGGRNRRRAREAPRETAITVLKDTILDGRIAQRTGRGKEV